MSVKGSKSRVTDSKSYRNNFDHWQKEKNGKKEKNNTKTEDVSKIE